MNTQRYDIVDAAEDASKFGYSLGVFACKAFYQVSNLEALKNSFDAYNLSRFSQRLEVFNHEHDKLSSIEKKEFYDELKSNKQNQNYLYDFVEKARTSTYDIHVKIYAVLSARLVKNKGLTYFENNILANMHTLNFEDIKFFAFNLNIIDLEDYIINPTLKDEKRFNIIRIQRQKKQERQKRHFCITEYANYYTYLKCLQLGIFVDAPQDNVVSNYGAITDVKVLEPLDNREILINENTLYFIDLLKEIDIASEL